MTKKTRTIIFAICFILFAIGGPSIILYSQGYRINLNAQEGEKVITSTGGIYVKALPKQANVYLNNKLIEKTDFIFGSILIENLIPGKYKVEVTKEGYMPWKKMLNVKEREVTEAKSIVLFPAEIDFTLISTSTEDIWATPDQEIIIKKETANGWVLNLYSPELGAEKNLLKEKDIYSKGVEFKGLTFATSSEAILETRILDKERYFKFNLEDVGGTIENIEKPAKEPQEYLLENYTFNYEDNILSVKESGSADFNEIASAVEGIRFSDDKKKLLYFTQHEVSIFFLENAIVPRKDSGEVMTLATSQEKITNSLWIDSDYVAISTENGITINELDTRDIPQTIILAETKNPEIVWNNSVKKLYYNNEEGLFASDRLLP
jgi:hypothetical protein